MLRYSSMRIAMVLPCALTRLHSSTEVSFAGAITKTVKKTKSGEYEGKRTSGSTRLLYSALKSLS